MNCKICGNKNTRLIYQNYPGYVENDVYDVYDCAGCDAQFVSPNIVDHRLYDIIYSDRTNETGPAGYGQHLIQAEGIKAARDPLDFLLKTDSNYYALMEHLRGKTGLEILEVGTGYGYLTFALNKLGHKAVGIDISVFTIDYALKHFGPYYTRADIGEIKDKMKEKKFDLIVGIEVLEHLPDPNKFIETAASLLKDDGKIILTTPNKGYYPDGGVWLNDQPPVHLFWFSSKTMRSIAERFGFLIHFENIAEYLMYHEKMNLLVNYLLLRAVKMRVPSPVFKETGELYAKETAPKGINVRKIVKRIARFFLVDVAPIRMFSNFLYVYLVNPRLPNTSPMGIVLWKK